jgi:hypothetical protein
MGVPLADGAGGLGPANRVLDASYGFCTALVMVTNASAHPPEFVQGERRNEASSKRRWGMNEETVQEVSGHAVRGPVWIGGVREPIRANFWGMLPLDRFF